MAKKPQLGLNTPSQNSEEPKKDNSVVDLESIQQQLLEKLSGTFDEKIQLLQEENEKLKTRQRDLESDTSRVKAAVKSEPTSILSTPSANRPKRLLDLERMFRAHGVGEKSLKFVRKKFNGTLSLKPEAIRYDGPNVIQMVYTKNHESPFVEDHPTNMQYESEPIVFSGNEYESAIIVPPTKPNLQKFLLAHPKINKTFELEDKEEIARKDLEIEDQIFESLEYVRTLFGHEHKMGSLITHMSSFDVALSVGLRESKLMLNEIAKDQFREVLKYKEDETLQKESEIRYDYGLALSRGLINESNRAIYLWDKRRVGNLDGEPGDIAFLRIIKQHPEFYNSIKQRLEVKE